MKVLYQDMHEKGGTLVCDIKKYSIANEHARTKQNA